jgi:hypothetical protein
LERSRAIALAVFGAVLAAVVVVVLVSSGGEDDSGEATATADLETKPN